MYLALAGSGGEFWVLLSQRVVLGVGRRVGCMRIAMVSMHTSPLEQAGVGDAGGMNVYIKNTALELGKLGFEVDIYTRATHPWQGSYHGEVVQVAPNVRTINCVAGPFEGLSKEDLPTQLAAFVRAMIAFQRRHGLQYDLIHSHYWLSGQAAWLLRELWEVPWVHTSHTLAAVKNYYLAEGDTREPESRRICEQQIVDHADALVVNTAAEVDDIRFGYDAEHAQIHVITPGADLEAFTPGTDRATERVRRDLGIPLRAKVVAFVGRIQTLKGPHILLEAMGLLCKKHPDVPLHVVFCGGTSGSKQDCVEVLKARALELGLARNVRFLAPRAPEALAGVYQAADIVAVPSHNESFGLVALEAQACATPVVAARVGGLPIAVEDQVSGILVDGHDPQDWADALEGLVLDDGRRIAMSLAAREHAMQFSWSNTAEKLGTLYRKLAEEHPAKQIG